MVIKINVSVVNFIRCLLLGIGENFLILEFLVVRNSLDFFYNVMNSYNRISFNHFIDVISFKKKINLKGCVHYIFPSLFLSLNESTCQTGKNVFYFTLKTLIVLEKIKF